MWFNYNSPQFLRFIILMDDNTVELFISEYDEGRQWSQAHMKKTKCVVAHTKCLSFQLYFLIFFFFLKVDNCEPH